jgi:hypothetical protein
VGVVHLEVVVGLAGVVMDLRGVDFEAGSEDEVEAFRHTEVAEVMYAQVEKMAGKNNQ